ncbi:DUF6879 family protein [Nocardia lijiangensis]|uniref:DUF6879 family protein n=1 Tax=Nocardia lijiangensis TaxID=299618 RepID=UPI003D708C11
MLLITAADFADTLRECERAALHLEVQDIYETPEESEPFARFLAGEPDDYTWMSEWVALVRETTGRGVAVRRARVVTVPHVDYQRWTLEVSRVNIAAGEEIRYLPRHLVSPDELTVDDWWLLDDRVAFTVFEPGGRWAGVAMTADRHIVDRCRAVWNLVWQRAIPHIEYMENSLR